MIQYNYPQFNIYFGSIGKTLGVRYQFTKTCKNEQEALKTAEELVTLMYYENEGKYGIPSFSRISEDSKLTGISIEDLYKDYIKYYMRWYVIPTDIDTISTKNLKLV